MQNSATARINGTQTYVGVARRAIHILSNRKSASMSGYWLVWAAPQLEGASYVKTVRRQRGRDLRLLGGGAVTARDRRSCDASLPQGIAHRDRGGRAADRAAW